MKDKEIKFEEIEVSLTHTSLSRGRSYLGEREVDYP